MIDQDKRFAKQEEKAKVRRRMQAKLEPGTYEYIPAKQPLDFYDNETHQRVGIYVRVSTDDIKQTTSFELQRKYYEDFVKNHPNWTLVKIYADEGISGTSLKNRDDFNAMIADAKAGKLDLIITKSVSRFARNVMICIGVVRQLAELRSPVGVFFESECIFSLNDDSQMALSFQAIMAEEESHTRSRSMETSLRMRLDNGIPLTPKLLGYTHDANGNLIINPEEAPTVKLAFYMYLYGYSTQQIADAFIALERRSYLGNIKWTANSIVQILRNERHCGDVLTRKTFTPDYRTHLSRRNRGERPQTRYFGRHPSIVSKDDFIAVQRLLDNAKYHNKSLLPELRVIDSGLLKGFVTIHPRWAGFKAEDYYQAAQSIYPAGPELSHPSPPCSDTSFNIIVEAGDLDLRGFEVARSELFDSVIRPILTIADRKLKFNTECVRKFGANNRIELLINPIEKKLAVRAAAKTNRNALPFSKSTAGVYYPKDLSAAAFYETLFTLFQWNLDYKYKIIGTLYEKGNERVYIFDAADSVAFFKPPHISSPGQDPDNNTQLRPLSLSGKCVRAIPEAWVSGFGKPYYLNELSFSALESLSEEDWKLRIEGQLFQTGKELKVTSYEELRAYIQQELRGAIHKEVHHE